jgi:hypothetical protein
MKPTHQKDSTSDLLTFPPPPPAIPKMIPTHQKDSTFDLLTSPPPPMKSTSISHLVATLEALKGNVNTKGSKTTHQ